MTTAHSTILLLTTTKKTKVSLQWHGFLGTKAASKVIKRLYGHNKYSYADEEDYDDRQMEASFDQIAREEFISKKIGKKEDEIEYKRMLARGEVPDI